MGLHAVRWRGEQAWPLTPVPTVASPIQETPGCQGGPGKTREHIMVKVLAAVLGMALLAGGPAYAGGFGHRGMKDLQKKAGVDDATAERIKQVRKKNEDARKALHGEAQEAREALEALVDGNSQDEAAYQKQLDRMAGAHQKLKAMREAELQEIRGMLKPSQQARVVLELRNKVKGHIRQRLSEGGGDGLF